MEGKEALNFIAKYYGLALQENQLIEECGELITALSKEAKTKTFKENTANWVSDAVIEEMADVEIMLIQVQILSNSRDKVLEVMLRKIDRQMKRIEQERILK